MDREINCTFNTNRLTIPGVKPTKEGASTNSESAMTTVKPPSPDQTADRSRFAGREDGD
jgi:hypothetical protein